MIEFEPIGIRRVYEDHVQSGQLRTIFRPALPKYAKLYGLGKTTELRIIKAPGSPRLDIKPVYTEDIFRVKITSFQELSLKDLTDLDFDDSYPDVHSAEDLAYHLGMTYDVPFSRYTPETRVIKIQLEYI